MMTWEEALLLFLVKATIVKRDLKIIYCIVGRNEIVKMKEMIHRIDPQAFITITEAHEILWRRIHL